MVLLAAVATGLSAQSILVVPPAGVAAPGSTVTVPIVNQTGQQLRFATSPWQLLRDDGELVAPILFGALGPSDIWGNGQSVQLGVQVPASGPGSSGSFVLRVEVSSAVLGAAPGIGVARFDVGAPASSFGALHMYPALVHGNGLAHFVDRQDSAQWEIANTDSVSHVLGAGDTVDVVLPGGNVPLARVSLAGIQIGPGAAVRVQLPIGGLADGAYGVRAVWSDPVRGLRSVEHGVRVGDRVLVDLHLPAGRTVPFGGSLPLMFIADGGTERRTPELDQGYAVAACVLPGSIVVGGTQVPLAMDPILQSSLDSALFGLIQNSIGSTQSLGVAMGSSVAHYQLRQDVALRHPGIAAVSGLELRLAVVTFDSVRQRFVASQSETIRFE